MGTTPGSLHILISGGGIAGNAVALQLLRAGFQVTVVERADAPRPGGQAVDLRTASREVAERLGILPAVRVLQVRECGWKYVDAQGRERARMPVAMFDGEGPAAEIEISRGDLNRVLCDELTAATGELNYCYGEYIEAITQHDSGVNVLFGSGRSEKFDLVIGADGVHSTTRRMVFGPDETYRTYLGGYMSFFTIPTPEGMEDGWLEMRTGHLAALAIRPDRDPATAKAIVTIRADDDPTLRGNVPAQHRLIRSAIGNLGWRAPLVLEQLNTTPDFYFDELARIDVPVLSVGRVTLLGDAGYCGSPLTGMGTALALVGAYLLAGELSSTPDDLPGALQRYQRQVEPFSSKAKELPGGGLKAMLPGSKPLAVLLAVAMRLLLSRPMRPVAKTLFAPKTQHYRLPEYS